MSAPLVLARVFIPLDRAALCLTCPEETIFDVSDLRCPLCGDGEHFAMLGKWLQERTERPTVEGFEVKGERPRIAVTPRRLAGLVGGVQGLPPSDEHHYVYQVGFQSLGPPTHAEAIVFVWNDKPVMDEWALRQEAVRLLALMVERGA